MARVKWDQMTDESQAMVKKVGLISLGGSHPVGLQQDDFSPSPAWWRQLCRLASPIQEVGHG